MSCDPVTADVGGGVDGIEMAEVKREVVEPIEKKDSSFTRDCAVSGEVPRRVAVSVPSGPSLGKGEADSRTRQALQCEKCLSEFCETGWLCCSTCSVWYHAACCDPRLDISQLLLARGKDDFTWNCNGCKVCFQCRREEPLDSLLFCDFCDRAIHMSCNTPVVTSVPRGRFVCGKCDDNPLLKNALLSFRKGHSSCSLDRNEKIQKEFVNQRCLASASNSAESADSSPSPVCEGRKRKRRSRDSNFLCSGSSDSKNQNHVDIDPVSSPNDSADDRFEPIHIGELTIESMGKIVNEYNDGTRIFPVGFRSTRLYSSFSQLGRRVLYVSEILEGPDGPIFSVTPEDGEPILARSATAAWMEVCSNVGKLRWKELRESPQTKVSGIVQFGLNNAIVRKLIFSLPGARDVPGIVAPQNTGFVTPARKRRKQAVRVKKLETLRQSDLRSSNVDDESCSDDDLRDLLGKHEDIVVHLKPPLPENPSGCCRFEPYKKRTFQDKQDMAHRVISLRHRMHFDREGVRYGFLHQTVEERTKTLFPMFEEIDSYDASAIVEEKVRAWRSPIHGWGGFAKAIIHPRELLLDYKGEIIRNSVADVRELLYKERGQDLYMFRIDDDVIVDATVKGNLARMVNHSCEPNCVTRCVKCNEDGKYHILIIAGRRIVPGEELTYDYNIEFEGLDEKIPCLCGARTCRGWMN